MFVNNLHLDLPDTFPEPQYEAFMAAARAKLLAPKGAAWTEFAGASNLIGWRFRGCHEDMEQHVELLSVVPESPLGEFDLIYRRERLLFGMFTSGVSCIESFCYGLYAAASSPNVLGVAFGLHEQRRAYPRDVLAVLKTHVPGGRATGAVDALVNAPEWTTWVELRNRMAHRSNLPRLITGNVGSPAPVTPVTYVQTSSTQAFGGSEAEIAALFDWLAATLRALLIAGTDLLQ